MKCLFLLLFPVFVFAQPKKAVIYSKKTSHSINGSIIVWNEEEAVKGNVFIGQRTLTIQNNQYSIDSTDAIADLEKKIYTYFLSLRGKQARCFLYPIENEKEWGLLLDTNSSMVLYKLRE